MEKVEFTTYLLILSVLLLLNVTVLNSSRKYAYISNIAGAILSPAYAIIDQHRIEALHSDTFKHNNSK